MEQEEIWKDIAGYEGLYKISSTGRVMSLYDAGHKIYRKKILKPHVIKDGRIMADLIRNKKRQQIYVHRLVATAFIPNPENLPEIDHIDTDITNNCVSNLRWCTSKGNSNNPLTRLHCSIAAKKRRASGVYDNQNKATCQFDMEMNLIAIWPSTCEAARQTGIQQSSIWLCCKNLGHTAGGYKWKYLSDYEQEKEG